MLVIVIVTIRVTLPYQREMASFLYSTCFGTRQQYHAIRFEAIIQNTTYEYVHHLLLIAFNGSDDCRQSCDERYDNPSQSTSSHSTLENEPAFCSYEVNYVYTWGPGIADQQLPDDVGFRFGASSGGYTSVIVQIHYNNVNGDEGAVDSSGIRVYYTEDMRPMDMGVIALGDPGVDLAGISVMEGKSFISFECPGSCTEDHFEVHLRASYEPGNV